MTAMQRRKGARAEVDFVNWLRLNGYPDARRYSGADGLAPGDIDAIAGVCFDVKNQKRYELAEWLTQAVDEAGPHRLPVVVIRPPGVTDPARWYALTHVNGLLGLLRDEGDGG